ncbi:hypothetical protein [Pigmentiphaga sp.]|uniref:hypothetical protein n=1 Tax=Pigmentiphaga sp. TaxID=1977564 RepID=UPI00128D606F|nr:hypothetical protein [Pigmentiphaga sp.]MPS29772.1 hypothetical protein [Alcaligenaceae bacterium SAGV5]MPS53489.1 hypothetical protein [Alcaligenaceae bacterium SAGV3]MPT58221.1 hypothetical protein [Alcaligenaceae bacterium]
MSLAHITLFALLGAVAPATAASWSGLYMGYYRGNGYITLQLLETKEGSVAGRYRQVVVTENGTEADFDAPVSGAIQGNQIIGRIERPWIQGGVIAFSGTRTNSGIRFSGGDGLQGNLTSSSERDEQATISELTSRAKQAANATRAAKAQQNADRLAKSGLVDIDTALKQAKEFQIRGTETVTVLTRVPALYEAVSIRQEKMATHARTLRDGAARSQVSVAMTQLIVEGLIGTNVKVENSESNARAAHDRVERSLSIAKTTCTQRASKGLYETEYHAKCQLILPATEAVGKLFQEMEALFKRLDNAFKTTEARSNALIAEVDELR